MVTLVKMGNTCKIGSHLENGSHLKKNGSHIDTQDIEK